MSCVDIFKEDDVMMKTTFTRFCAFVLAAVLAVSGFTMTAAATEAPVVEATVAENTAAENTQTITFQITSEGDEGVIAVPMSSTIEVDQTFTMTTSHRGADRTYYGNRMRYVVTITDADGNSVDNAVAVELWDYNHGTPIQSSNVSANGSSYGYTVPITNGRVYYFKYTKISGTTRTLRVRMTINSYTV